MSAEYISRKVLDSYQDRWTLKIQRLHTKFNNLIGEYHGLKESVKILEERIDALGMKLAED